ncbi:hypothetical protein AWB77_00463 [Caballeronia fortuita]|uniref:Uncharacterized protein n=1 Tax=Caballeronia fortuita TaxID=1777138 RepID=A0A157ZAH2_9BURK|nr:hypothetical protein AWB77_00463 [Caballeronia fortuita]
MQSAAEANGAIHLGPETSLVDASIRALDGKTPPARCLSGLKTLYKSHPLMLSASPTNIAPHGKNCT